MLVIFSILLSTGGTETRGRKGTGYAHTTSYLSQVFLLDPTGIFTRRNRFFLQREAGVSVCMRTPFVTPLVRHKINGMYRIFLSGVSDFWKSFLFVSATKNLLYLPFFLSDTSDLFLFEICSYSRTHASSVYAYSS